MLNEFLDNFQFLSKRPGLYYRGLEHKQSYLLFSINLLAVTVITAIVGYILYAYISFKNKILIIRSKQTDNQAIDTIGLMFGLNSPKGDPIKLDNKEVTITFSTNKQTISCENEKFILTQELGELMFENLCYENSSFTWGSPVSIAISFNQKLDSQYLKNKYFGSTFYILYKTILVNESDLSKNEPLMDKLLEYDMNELLFTTNSPSISYEFMISQLYNDLGYLWYDYEVTSFIELNNTEKTYYQYQSLDTVPNSILKIALKMSSKTKKLVRSSPTIPELFAQIVGVYFVIMFLAWIITIWYREANYFYEIVKKNFKVETLEQLFEEWEIHKELEHLKTKYKVKISQYNISNFNESLSDNSSDSSEESIEHRCSFETKLPIIEELKEANYETKTIDLIKKEVEPKKDAKYLIPIETLHSFGLQERSGRISDDAAMIKDLNHTLTKRISSNQINVQLTLFNEEEGNFLAEGGMLHTARKQHDDALQNIEFCKPDNQKSYVLNTIEENELKNSKSQQYIEMNMNRFASDKMDDVVNLTSSQIMLINKNSMLSTQSKKKTKFMSKSSSKPSKSAKKEAKKHKSFSSEASIIDYSSSSFISQNKGSSKIMKELEGKLKLKLDVMDFFIMYCCCQNSLRKYKYFVMSKHKTKGILDINNILFKLNNIDSLLKILFNKEQSIILEKKLSKLSLYPNNLESILQSYFSSDERRPSKLGTNFLDRRIVKYFSL